MSHPDPFFERRVNPPRRKTDGDLQTARERLSLAVDAAHLGTFYCPVPLGCIEWNDTCKEHFWLPPDAEVDFEVFYSILHVDDRERVREAVATAVFERERYDVEYRTVAPDGRIRWIRAMGRGFYDEGGQPVRFDGVTVDITPHKLEQEALEKQQRQLQAASARLALLSEIADATRDLGSAAEVMQVTVERLGRHLRVSRCAYATVDDDEETFAIVHDYTDGCASTVGDYRLSLFGPEAVRAQRGGETLVLRDVDAELATTGGAEMFAAIGIKAIVCCPLRKGGRLVAMMAVHQEEPRDWTVKEIELVQVVVARSSNYIDAVHASMAISEQRERLLQAERAARAEAERASQMKDEFLATLSHELRTPLSAILGWAQIIKMQLPSGQELVDAAALIERNARVQAQIIEDLLDMSRIISGKIRLDVHRVELPAVVDAAIETVRPAADARGVTIEAIYDPRIQPVGGDAGRLQQIFWNLLSNAIKFTPRDGRVQVRVEPVGGAMEASVIDDGDGISPELLPHVFERFRQADSSSTRRHGGLGLGLAIVRQLAEVHGGGVRAESEGPGRGSRFIVTLPVAPTRTLDAAAPFRRASKANTQRLTIPASLPSIRGVRVMVVDDEPDARALAKRLLEGEGAEVATAASAREAFRLIQADPPDVLVSDIGMPEEDGFALIRAIRALPPESGGAVPALALTAYARAEDREHAFDAGFQLHLAKPVEAGELLSMVARLSGRVHARTADAVSSSEVPLV